MGVDRKIRYSINGRHYFLDRVKNIGANKFN